MISVGKEPEILRISGSEAQASVGFAMQAD